MEDAPEAFLSLLAIERNETAQQTLAAAEQLFAEQGFAGTSMRMLTKAAKVNLAAVNYHFDNKEGLLEAVFMRRFIPLMTECLGALDVLETRSGRITAEEVMLTFVRPCLRLSKTPQRRGALFVRLLSRMMLDHQAMMRDTITEHYGEFLPRYLSAFQRALPDVAKPELEWRVHFAFNVIFHAFAGNDVLRIFAKSQVVTARDPDKLVKHLLPFVLAGLEAKVNIN